MSKFRFTVPLLAFLLCPFWAFAFPSDNWHRMISEHFNLSYNDRTVDLAEASLKIAEETLSSLTSYFGTSLGKDRVTIVLDDHSDVSNGGAYADFGTIRIDCRKTPFLFREIKDWLRTVITHELSHIYSIRIFKPWLRVSLTATSRSDAVSSAGSVSMGDLGLPSWFLEGVAQMGSYKTEADDFDPIREMILKDAFFQGRLLDLDQMSRFDGTSLDSELTYNQGFAFLLHLERSYPGVLLTGLCEKIRSHGFAQAFQKHYGKALAVLFEEWKASLSSRYGLRTAVGTPLFHRTDPMVLEVASARSGRFVVANWGHDYARFSLFERTPDGQYRTVAGDTGAQVKFDPVTQEGWFNKLSYNFQTGTDNYDLYRIGADGSVKQATSGSRSLAFDALGGTLVYAKYSDTDTHLVRRTADGKEELLATFQAETSVNTIALFDSQRILLSLGTPRGSRLALWRGGELQYLWPDAEIWDPVRGGGERIFFASPVSGSPQIYWTDLSDPSETWFQVTQSAGARYPAIDAGDDEPVLFFSEYGQGGYHLAKLESPFSRAQATPVPAASTPVSAGKERKVTAKAVPGLNMISYFEPIQLNIRGIQSQTAEPKWRVRGGFEGYFFDAPMEIGFNYGLTASLPITIRFPLESSQAEPLGFLWKLGAFFSLGPLQNSLSYSGRYDPHKTTDPNYTYSYQYSDLSFESMLQLGSHFYLSPYLRYHGESFSYKYYSQGSSFDYFSEAGAGILFQYGESPYSIVDPARLGRSSLGFYLDARLFKDLHPVNAFSNDFYDMIAADYFNASSRSLFLLNLPYMARIAGGAGFRALFDSRLSVGFEADGFYYHNATEGTLLSPFALETMGGEEWFSGYPEDYALLNDLVRATLEIKTNPLIDRGRRAQWPDRLHVGTKLQAGYGHYYSIANAARGLRTALPLSWESSIGTVLFLSPERSSALEIHFAMPLNDFLPNDGGPVLTVPWQVYFELNY